MPGDAEAHGAQKARSVGRKPNKDGKCVEAAAEGHHRSPKPGKKARMLRKEGRYTEAIREYQKLIEALGTDQQRHIDLLKLRCHVGSCLLESLQRNRDTRSKEQEYEYAESYLRETLRKWRSAEGKDRAVGVATTQNDLAQCLIRHAESRVAHGKKEKVYRKVKEATELFEDVLSYRNKQGQQDDGSVELVLKSLFAAKLKLSEDDWHYVEQFSRRELLKLRKDPTLYSEQATIALKRHLADALFVQEVYGEARRVYNDIIQLLRKRGEVRTLEEYEQFVKAIIMRRWDLACGYARDEVWRRRLAAYRHTLDMARTMEEETRLNCIRRKWRACVVVVRLTVWLSINCNERRKLKALRSFQILLHASLFLVRLRRLRRRRWARQKWQRAGSCVLARNRANMALMFFRQRRTVTYWRWRAARSHALIRAGINIDARRRCEELWYTLVVRAGLRKKWSSLVASTLCAMKLRIRLGNLRRKKEDSWQSAPSSCYDEQLPTPFVTPLLEPQALPDPESSLLYPEDFHLLSNGVQTIESTSEIFFGARNTPGYESLDKNAKVEADKWMKAYGSFCNRLAMHSRTQSENFPVKVAIIDTGIDVTNAFVHSRWLCQGKSKEKWNRMSAPDRATYQTKRIAKCYKDFLDSPSDLPPDLPSVPNDEDGHGTHISGLILRYAPNAHLYVARVAKNRSSCKSDPKFERRVVDAIRWALDKWQVDIISLSFALHGSVLRYETDKLIDQANSSDARDGKQKTKTIIVAAACNEGGREPVPYPANHDMVINVRALTGYGKDADFSPYPMKYDPNFSILGTHVLSTWPNRLPKPGPFISESPTSTKLADIEGVECMTNCMDGTSFSAPLIVALIANVFAFYFEHKSKIVPPQYQSNSYAYEVQNYKAVRKILLHMSQEHGRINVVCPWKTGNFAMSQRDRTVQELCTAICWALESD